MRNLAYAFRPLANDLAASLLFAALVAAHAPPLVATLAAMGFGVAHVLLFAALRRPIAPLQWAGLGLVLTFGAASLFLHDLRFLMAKSTVVFGIIAAVMLQPGWMLRYMPPIARDRGEGLMVVFGYVWAGLFAALALANLAIAWRWPGYWPAFKAVVPLGAQLTLFAIQYLTIRAVVRPQVMAEAAQAQPRPA